MSVRSVSVTRTWRRDATTQPETVVTATRDDDTIRDHNVRSIAATRVSLIYRTESTTKNWKTENLKSKKKRYAQKYRHTVRGIRGVSPGEEKEGYEYGGKDLQKRKVQAWNERVRR